MSLKTAARALCPPLVWSMAGALKRRIAPPPPPPLAPPAPLYGCTGNYASFDEALAECSGYDTGEAVAYAKRTLEVARTRDGAMLDPCAVRLLAALELAAARLRELEVLDFGGGLGYHYFALRRYLPVRSWTVCELHHMALAGAAEFADGTLRFVESLERCRPNVVLASGVLQCCRAPRSDLARICALGARYVALDRLPVLEAERLTLQRVPPELFSGAFPCWYFGADFLRTLPGRRVLGWRLPEHLAHLDGAMVDCYQGMLLELTPA